MTRLGDVLPRAVEAALPAAVAARRANWIEVARKDVADASRSWQLPVLTGLFVVLVLLAGAVNSLSIDGLPFHLGLDTVKSVTRWLVPLMALVVGYRAVIGEHDNGSLRVLVGLPVTRGDVVVGKLVGRAVVLGVAVLAGLALAGVELWYLYPGFDLRTYAVFVGLTLGYGSTFVAVGVGISAFSRSRARAVGAATGVFALVAFLWEFVPKGLFYLLNGRLPRSGEPVSPWYPFLGNANPYVGYESLFRELVRENLTGGPESLATASYGGGVAGGPEPLYLQPAFLLVVLSLWGIVPVVLGAWRFSRSDLG